MKPWLEGMKGRQVAVLVGLEAATAVRWTGVFEAAVFGDPGGEPSALIIRKGDLLRAVPWGRVLALDVLPDRTDEAAEE